jgi:prevent-host-death family protein
VGEASRSPVGGFGRRQFHELTASGIVGLVSTFQPQREEKFVRPFVYANMTQTRTMGMSFGGRSRSAQCLPRRSAGVSLWRGGHRSHNHPRAMYNTEGVDSIATITELRSETADLIESVRKSKRGILIQKNNQPHAVLIDWEMYKKIKNVLGVSSLSEIESL